MHNIALCPWLKPTCKDSVLFLLLVHLMAEIWLLCLWSELVKATHHQAFSHCIAFVCIYTQREFKGNVGLVFLRSCLYHIYLFIDVQMDYIALRPQLKPTCKGVFLTFLLLVLSIPLLAEIGLFMTVKWRGRPSGEGYGCDERCGSPIAGAPSPCH